MDNWRRMYKFMKAQEAKREAQPAPTGDSDDDDSAGDDKPAPKGHRKSTSRQAH